MIHIKNAQEIMLMREAGRLNARAMEYISGIIEPGISTLELDKSLERYIINNGGVPSSKGYNGFPGSACFSVNDVVVHGIPSRNKLRQGDILGVDLTVLLNGYQSDMARTFPVGDVSEEAKDLISVAKECFNRALDAARPGNRVGDIGWAVQSYAEARGYSVVRALCGHGIGRQMHEDPEVPNYGSPGRGVRLREGMVLAIEPMINAGAWQVYTDEADGWTVRTSDKRLSAHHENTVAITAGPAQILTEP